MLIIQHIVSHSICCKSAVNLFSSAPLCYTRRMQMDSRGSMRKTERYKLSRQHCSNWADTV